MDAYEKMIMTMRNEAQNSVQGSSFGLAVMTGTDTLTYNGLELDADDILIADHLTMRRLSRLDFSIQSSGGTSHSHGWTDQSEYIEPLAEGDIVFGVMIESDDDQKFLVLCRVGGA